MKKTILILITIASILHATQKITPSEVYSEVMQIEKELKLISTYLKKSMNVDFNKIKTSLKPRHAWQKTYEIMVKINILRTSHSMPIIEPPYLEPVLHLDPILTYEQTQRILTEIDIFKIRMGIKKEVSKRKKYSNKRPIDVFNELSNISNMMDLINGNEFTPSHVFGETMRIFDDITLILAHLNINDETIPTKKRINSKPIDTFNVAMNLLLKIKNLQESVSIESVNFYEFRKMSITPSDVFGLNQMILAELQTLKAYIGLNGYVTSPSKQYQNKTPADVEQMMGWSLRQISLIESLYGKGK